MSKFESLSFNEKIKNLFTFDMIRLQKLLEISQNVIISMVVGFFLGYLVDHMFPPYVNNENKSIGVLVLEVISQAVVLAISMYYAKKIMRLIPFLFNFDNNYIPSMKGENMLGINIGMGILFVTNQTHFKAKLTALRQRILGGN